MWHLYLIRTKLGHLYTGITQDVQRRFKEHEKGGVKAAKSLKGKNPLILVYHQEIGSHSLALKTEAAIKKWPKDKKESLVRKKISLEI
ncbi:MAG: putative endonuclease [Nitrospinales bacterium]|jgi:putative endonuclease